MATYDERPVPRGTSHRWEVLIDEEADRPHPHRRLMAIDVRTEHRVLQELSEAALRDMPLLEQGTTLARRCEYLDVHDPGRADFRAEGGEVVRPGQRIVARADLAEEAWQALRNACDRVARRRRLPKAS